jgi:hypothetical protein
MPAFNRNHRLPSLLIRSGRKPSEAGPYVVAAAVTVGALAITALITQHLAKKAQLKTLPLVIFWK